MQRRLPAAFTTFTSVALLLFFTEALYIPFSVLRGASTIYGWDYLFLHARRLSFARDALFGGAHRLPGWYPREMLGSPFAGNLQNFPWIPTHLPLLLFNPDKAYAVGIAISSALAALFTFLYCRRLGLSQVGAAAAGWTFACAGFFAAHVTVGHLVLLEGYPSLPLLLWLADRAIDSAAHRGRHTIALAIGTACVVLAGHPQLPAYSVAVTLFYVIWRGEGWARLKLLGGVAFGIGSTMIAWWPMLLLIRRSSRALPLDAAANDVMLPLHRILGFIAPGIDGWPANINVTAGHSFTGFSDNAYFWETFAYVGLLPLIAAGGLILRCMAKRRLPSSRWLFLAVVATVALLGALPLFESSRQALHATIFRSPARLLYLCTFALAAALGGGVDALLRWERFGHPVLVKAGLIAGLAFHAWDLGRVSRLFIVPGPLPLEIPVFRETLAGIKDARIAISRILALRLGYDYDDAGGFDAIFLANSYEALLALSGAPAKLNEEGLDASTWTVDALEATGVQYVIPWVAREDLAVIGEAAGLKLYRVPHPAPRSNGITYERPSPDVIAVRSDTVRASVVSVLEAYDPGWAAEVDGRPATVQKARGLGMDVQVGAGEHVVRFRYHTVGRGTGAVLSVISVCLLAVLLAVNSENTWSPWATRFQSVSPPRPRRTARGT